MKDSNDMNRDPITHAPGSHPVGVGVGGVGGAAVGAGIGALFGPIGMLVGGVVGTLAGAGAGKGLAERIDPTGESEYWRNEYSKRPYADSNFSYDTDYEPAYQYGTSVRTQYRDRSWDDTLEQEIRSDWDNNRGTSRLSWEQARGAVADAFDRADRTYRTYNATDSYYRDHYSNAEYYRPEHDFDADFRPAYRYGTQARSLNPDRTWDSSLESELGNRWDHVRGTSKLEWNDAKQAVKDAWHKIERALPGDADRDGR